MMNSALLKAEKDLDEALSRYTKSTGLESVEHNQKMINLQTSEAVLAILRALQEMENKP